MSLESTDVELDAAASRNLSKVTFVTSVVSVLSTGDYLNIMSIDAGLAKGTACD